MTWNKSVFDKFDFRMGDQILATVEEVTSPVDLIVHYRGNLFRVVNDSGKKFEKGDHLHLKIIEVNPLRFRLLESSSQTFERFV